VDKEIFFSLTAKDLNLYYGNSFLRVRKATNQPFRWIKAMEFSGKSSGVASAMIVESPEGPTVPWPFDGLDIDFTPPENGIYAFKNTVMVVERTPIRQTTKGLHKTNTSISNLLAPVRMAGAIPNTFYNANDFHYKAEHLNLLFEDMEPLSWEKGLQKILKKQAMAVPVNQRIALSQGILSAFPTIWLKHRVIGELHPAKETIYPLHDAFIPELAQAFLDKGYSIDTD
jgi:hypothetical protein